MRDLYSNIKALKLIKAKAGPTSTDDGGLAVDTRGYNGHASAVLNVVITAGQDNTDIVTVSLHEVAAFTADVADLVDANKIATFVAVAGVVGTTEVDGYQQISVDLNALTQRYIEAKLTVAGSAVYVVACSLLCDLNRYNPVN